MARRSLWSIALLFGGLAAACSEAPTTAMSDSQIDLKKATATPGSSQADWLKALKQASAQYNSMTQASKAGHVADAHCVASPAGGMGYHWANFALVDPIFDPLQPEVILYASLNNKNLKLVAVEYVVINVGQPRPEFAGYPFDIGGVAPLTAAGVPHWSLHVWLYEDNPNGIFTPFNPVISCP